MDAVRTRIDEWERSGLIDGPTAGRLRDSVATSTEGPATDVGPAAPASPGPAPAPEPAPPRPGPSSTSISAVFGPGVTIGEMFSYLGVGFIVGAWSAFVIRVAGERADVTVLGGGALVTAIGLIVLGIVLDGALRTSPLFLFAGLVVGILASVWVVYERYVKRYW